MLHDQVVKRDQEIKRLGVQLEISRAQQWGGSAVVQQAGTSIGIDDLPLAKRRIDQLEQQIELLQEHAESLEKEIGNFNEEKRLIYETCNVDKEAVEKELEACKTRNNALVRNLGKLEEMINDLEDMKSKDARNGKRNVMSIGSSAAPITKGIRQMAELEEKNRHLQDRLKRTNGQLKTSSIEFERMKFGLIL